jgi:CPA1 family monovalent cation:H+ antiporter
VADSSLYFAFMFVSSATLFGAIAIFVTIVAAASYVNFRFLKFPMAIGLMIVGLILSFILVGLHAAGLTVGARMQSFIVHASFSNFVMSGILSFLLFAGALTIDISRLREDGIVVGVLATIGVVLSTFFIAAIFFFSLRLLSIHLSFSYCLVFGALISPTDPLAILSILQHVRTKNDLYTKIAGESLFNDGVGVVLFVVSLAVASGSGGIHVTDVMVLIVREALGGVVFGLAIGWIVYKLLASVDNYTVEILLSLALVTGGYALASLIGVSGPLSMVVAGLIIGSRGRALAMSETTRRNLDLFWELADNFLNATLFVWMGLELLALSFTWTVLLAGLIAIPLTLLARFLSVGSTIRVLRFQTRLPSGSIVIMTWGGLRGALAIAMALSIPPGPARDLIVPVTYIVVVFSILVQGLTMRPILLRTWKKRSMSERISGVAHRLRKRLPFSRRRTSR